MANFLVVAELVDDRVPPTVLEIVGQARRVASELGATLFVLLPLPVRPPERLDEIGAELGRHGADRIVAATIASAEDAPSPAAAELTWSNVGAQILSILEAVPPRLVLFPLSAGAREVAPRLAARINAAFLADGWFELREGHLVLGEDERGLEGEIDFPIVMTVGPGRYALAAGDSSVEVDLLPTDAAPAEWESTGPLSAPPPMTSADGYVRVGQVELLGKGGRPAVRGLCQVRCAGAEAGTAHFSVDSDLATTSRALAEDL